MREVYVLIRHFSSLLPRHWEQLDLRDSGCMPHACERDLYFNGTGPMPWLALASCLSGTREDEVCHEHCGVVQLKNQGFNGRC
jgi:hypothetical protein